MTFSILLSFTLYGLRHTYGDDTYDDTYCLSTDNTGCGTLVTEAECTTSKHNSDPMQWYGQACVWCSGDPCFGGDSDKCTINHQQIVPNIPQGINYEIASCAVDECDTGEHECHSNADCTDTLSGYECKCKDGFSGDGKNICESDEDWTQGFTSGRYYAEPEYAHYERVDIGETEFNAKFQTSGTYIIRRLCDSCDDEHKVIYYKRLTDPTNFDAYTYMNNWQQENNDMDNGDFALYSTLDDAKNDENRWDFCNYDQDGFVDYVGAFGGCGKTEQSFNQWTVRGGQYWITPINKDARFDIYTPEWIQCGSSQTSIEIPEFVFYGVMVLLVVNIICLTINCWNNNCKSNKRGYKVINYESEVTDV